MVVARYVMFFIVLSLIIVDAITLLSSPIIFKQTSDISYYDPLDGPNGKWTKIGDLSKAINTPVCDFSLNVNGEDWMYCESGSPNRSFSKRRKISAA